MTELNGSLERFYREHRQMLFTYALAFTRCGARATDVLSPSPPTNAKAFAVEAAPDTARALPRCSRD